MAREQAGKASFLLINAEDLTDEQRLEYVEAREASALAHAAPASSEDLDRLTNSLEWYPYVMCFADGKLIIDGLRPDEDEDDEEVWMQALMGGPEAESARAQLAQRWDFLVHELAFWP